VNNHHEEEKGGGKVDIGNSSMPELATTIEQPGRERKRGRTGQ